VWGGGAAPLHQCHKLKNDVGIRVKGLKRLFLFLSVLFPDFFYIGPLQNLLNTICVRIRGSNQGQTVLHGGRKLPININFRNIHVVSKFTYMSTLRLYKHFITIFIINSISGSQDTDN
jgi:hypothetical protein